jgi:hypothetical protein
MRTVLLITILAILALAVGGFALAACETLEVSTTLGDTVTTTGPTARHWEEGGISLDWPEGWRAASLEGEMHWPLGRLIDCTLLCGLEQGETYPKVELVRRDLGAGETLQTAFDRAYVALAAEWGDSLREVSGWTITVNGSPALVKSYEIPHGEPYYKCQDVWVEWEGSLYVLAGRGGVWTFDEEVLPDFEAMTQSLRMSAGQ